MREQLEEILRRLPSKRQTVFFSATLPHTLVEFTRAGLNDPLLVRLDLEHKLSPLLQVSFILVDIAYIGFVHRNKYLFHDSIRDHNIFFINKVLFPIPMM